jgi:hypothetical protein
MKRIFFSTGRRCNAANFLRENDITEFGSPFDWMFCDMETAIHQIKTGFADFLTDVLIGSKVKKNFWIVNPTGKYNVDDYSEKICSLDLKHLDENEDARIEVQRRCDRIYKHVSESPERCSLVHFSRIIEDETSEEFMDRVQSTFLSYELGCEMICLMYSPNNDEKIVFEDRGDVKFFLMKCESRERQIRNSGGDNHEYTPGLIEAFKDAGVLND